MKLSDLRKHKKFLIAVVCVLAAIAMGAVFLQPEAEPEDDVIWREYPVKLGTITASLDGSGLLEATGIHRYHECPVCFREGADQRDWHFESAGDIEKGYPAAVLAGVR